MTQRQLTKLHDNSRQITTRDDTLRHTKAAHDTSRILGRRFDGRPFDGRILRDFTTPYGTPHT